jgi:hypothetical protein
MISKKSSSLNTALPNESKLGRKHPWKVIYKNCAFSSHPLINMKKIGQLETRIAYGGHVC